MDNNIVSKTWVEMSATSNTNLLQFRIQSHFQKTDIECQYNRTHKEEKSSKIRNIRFAILPFSQKNTSRGIGQV